MARRVARALLLLALAAVGILLVLAVAYFARGSLEEFPTPEDHAKVRTVTAVAAVFLIGIGIALWTLLRGMTQTSPGSAVDRASLPATEEQVRPTRMFRS